MGFRALKVKMGDPERRRAAPAPCGQASALPIRVDANGGWHLDDAVQAAPSELEAAGVELLEQPLPDRGA